MAGKYWSQPALHSAIYPSFETRASGGEVEKYRWKKGEGEKYRKGGRVEVEVGRKRLATPWLACITAPLPERKIGA